MTTPANPARTTEDTSTEAEQTPTPTTPKESDTGSVSARSSAIRAVGKWSNVAVRKIT